MVKLKKNYLKYWNRLHRFQKTLVLIVLVLSVLYVLSHIEFHHKQLKSISSKHEHQPLAKDKTIQRSIPNRVL